MAMLVLATPFGLDDGAVIAAITAGTLTALAVGLLRFWERFRASNLQARLNRFLRPSLRQRLQTHQKSFPGYDLVSVSRALSSFFTECCHASDPLGTTHGTDLQTLMEPNLPPYMRNSKPGPPTYERMAVDVDQEESVVTNCVYLCVLRRQDTTTSEVPEGEKIVLWVRAVTEHADYDEDMRAQGSRATTVFVDVACRTREIADYVFHEIETRRARLCIFRGKVIDPVIAPGGIRTITFKKLVPVGAEDLVLPERVLALLHGSIVGFYEHESLLRQLGVEMKRGILLHSLPGTGKTSVCLYLAGLLKDFTICFVSGRRLLYPRELCNMARYLQPTMLVFEDIDLIAQERDANGLATVLGELMNQIDGCEPTDRVLFIMNTNSMDRMEQAVRNRPGRVDQIIHLPLPDLEARKRLLNRFARNLHVAEDVVERVAVATDGATPAVLKEVVKRAAVLALQRDGQDGARALSVTAEDLLLAYEQVRYMREEKSVHAEIL